MPFPWPESLVLELVTAPPLLLHSEAPMPHAFRLDAANLLPTVGDSVGGDSIDLYAAVEHQLG